MKKLFLSLFVFATSAVYVAYQYMGGNSSNISATQLATDQPQTPTIADTSTTSPVPAHTPVQTPVVTPTPVTTPATKSTPTPTKSIPVTTATPTPTPVATPTPTPVVTPTPAPKPKGQYVDGSYTGAAADAFYGTVQVQAVISGGKLVTVNFLQYPNDRSNSVRINSRAIPVLQQEAIQAQSASVSGVSGASYTSAAFKQSLGDALAQAKNS